MKGKHELMGLAILSMEDRGCHTQGVMANNSQPEFLYSVGFKQNLHLPEIITFMGLNVGYGIMDVTYNLIKQGERIEADKRYEDIIIFLFFSNEYIRLT
jgi:hypothetical protein